MFDLSILETVSCLFGIDDIAIGAVVGAIIAGGASLYNGYKANKNAEDVADKNYEAQTNQLNYQKYLNKNQIQLQASDAQKAGINPLAMNSGTLSSGSWSNINQQYTPIDTSGLTNVIDSYMSNRTQKKVADSSNETQKAINAENIASTEKMHREKLASESALQTQRLQQEIIMQDKSLSSAEKIARLQATTQKEINSANISSAEKIASDKNALDELIASNQLSQKEAQDLRVLNNQIDEFNRVQSGNAEVSQAQLDKMYNDSLNSAWNVYHDLMYGESSGSLYGAVSTAVEDRFESMLSGFGALISGDNSARRNRLDYSQFSKWFSQHYKGAKTLSEWKDVSKVDSSWSWSK